MKTGKESEQLDPCTLFFWRSETKGVCDFYMQDKDCRKNEISYIALLPVALPLDEIDQRQKHQVRYDLIRMYVPFISAHMSLCPYCYLHYYIRFLFLKLLNFLTFL